MGDYYQGQKEGKGRFSWFDGAWYEGDFKNNNIEGSPNEENHLQDRENMFGQISASTKEIGWPIRCTGGESFHGQMVNPMKVCEKHQYELR